MTEQEPNATAPPDAPAPGPKAPRDTAPIPDALAEVVARIADEFRPRQIVLFSSRAYGEPTAESDVDPLVVLDTSRRSIEEAVRIRRAISRIATFPLDVVVRTPEQIRVGLEEGDFFLTDVMTKGIVLIEAGDAGVGRQG